MPDVVVSMGAMLILALCSVGLFAYSLYSYFSPAPRGGMWLDALVAFVTWLISMGLLVLFMMQVLAKGAITW